MRRISMHRLQDIVRLHRLGERARAIARMLKISPNTERRYRHALEQAGLLHGDPDELPELAALQRAVEAALPFQPLPQQASSLERWRPHIEALIDDGAAPKAIFDRLRLEHADFNGTLSAVKRLYASTRRKRGICVTDVAIPVDTAPGKVAQVDFGAVGKLWDPQEKRGRTAYVFVMVLGHSRHQFARIVFDQKLDTWLSLHIAAFEHFGGVPEVIVPDNLKSAVVRAAFDVRTEPSLNRSYRELARHFGFKIDPTPAYSPEKKGKVESAIRYVKSNFFSTIGDERNVNVLNIMVARWVIEIAGTRTHGTTCRQPLVAFETTERAHLLSLPAAKWQRVWWREPAIHRDCCGLVEQARYSVPWRLVGKRLLARVTDKSVELYWENTRVATHERQPPGGRSVQDEHLPPERGEYRQRERSYWVERAETLGVDVHRYVNEVFDSDDVLNQLTKVQAIIRHLETFPRTRANAACRRASYFGGYSYATIKNILRKGLDLVPLPQLVMPSNGALECPRFARNTQELLDSTLETSDASH
ncbi:MAG: IS21 family transposase [Myxococcales bacterium FL481]|nr:MAG: IS21 family transposase [Myxococcales bacterium FL481]